MEIEISGDTLEAMCNIIQVIIAGINLLMILYFFGSDRKRYKKEYESSIKKHWYHNIVMDQNLLKITEFYDNYSKIVLDSNSSLAERFDKLGLLGLDFERNVLTLISVVDKSLNEFIANNNEEMEDFISERLQKIEEIRNNNVENTEEISATSEGSFISPATLELECTNKIQKVKKAIVHKIYMTDLELSPYTKKGSRRKAFWANIKSLKENVL